MIQKWSKIDLDKEINHGVLERDKAGEVLQPKWKYLIRKYQFIYILKRCSYEYL